MIPPPPCGSHVVHRGWGGGSEEAGRPPAPQTRELALGRAGQKPAEGLGGKTVHLRRVVFDLI